jgi:hypothetical protein
MNSAGKNAVMVLLAISIAGCTDKKANTAPPPQAQAPSVDAGKAGALYPPPLTPAQPQPEQPTPAPAPVEAKTEPPPQPEPPPQKKKTPPARKGKTPATKPTTPTTATPNADTPETPAPAAGQPTPTTPAGSGGDGAPTDVATTGEPPAASPIGQISTGDASEQAQTRKETVDLITSTENGLNGIKRTFNAQEQETANQIKLFLDKAKTALKGDDLDGARILATKAKVLLDELNKT